MKKLIPILILVAAVLTACDKQTTTSSDMTNAPAGATSGMTNIPTGTNAPMMGTNSTP